jgi:hypothetical protein
LLPAVFLFTGFGMLFYSASLYEFLQEFRHGPQHEKPLSEKRQDSQHGPRNGKQQNTVKGNSMNYEPSRHKLRRTHNHTKPPAGSLIFSERSSLLM